jgi:hypothetical protein
MRNVAALLVAACLLPASAGAETPTYARPLPSGDQIVTGIIDDFSGKYGLTLRDDRGYLDNVRLHQGTVIEPTGTQLRAGMHVTLIGHPEGRVFVVDEVDVPQSEAAPPAYVSPFAPYPDYVPYGYGYGSDYYSYGGGYSPLGVAPWPYYTYPTGIIIVVPAPAAPSPMPTGVPPHQWRHTLTAPTQAHSGAPVAPPAIHNVAPAAPHVAPPPAPPPARTVVPPERVPLAAPAVHGGGMIHR